MTEDRGKSSERQIDRAVEGRYFPAIFFLSSVLLFQGCAGNLRSHEQPFNHLSVFEKKEIEMGKQIHDEVLSSFYLYTEPNLLGYVNRIGSSVTHHAKRQKFNYHVTVLLSEKIFATSAPGGYLYLTTGFLNFLENEAQLAGVLAHEVGQLQYKHPRLSGSRKAIEALSVGSSLVGGFFGNIGVLAMLGIRAVDLLTDEKSREERVYTADKLSLDYLVQAGYDPECWLDVLRRLRQIKEQNVALVVEYDGIRPITEKRFQRLNRQLKKMDLGRAPLEAHGQVYMDAIKGVREIYGTAAPAVPSK